MHSFLHRIRHTHFMTLFITVSVAAMAIIIVILTQGKVFASSPSVEPLSPRDNATANGSVTLSSRVNNLNPDQYEMFWAVGNGEWNRMDTDASTKVSTAIIDINGWNWQPDNRYTIRFIALVKDGWYTVERSITIQKGQAAAAQPTPATPAPARAPDSTSASEAPTLSPPVQSLAPSNNSGLYVDPNSTAAQQLASRQGNPALSYIAAQPATRWFGGWNGNVREDVNAYVSQAAAAGKLPTLVVYNIPHRDCGSYSAGGANSSTEYLNWIGQVAAGINGRPALVIVEPDALAGIGCLDAGQRTARMDMIARSVRLLKTDQSRVYIDAGHPGWQSTATMASRLRMSGADVADGFSLNISNFRTTEDNIRYGTSLAAQLDGAHFVIDTSRNGTGPAPDGEWCNPEERGLGHPPTLSTDRTLVDAYLWIKTPGDSDGSCGRGAPAAGQWWQQYAEMLYNNRR